MTTETGLSLAIGYLVPIGLFLLTWSGVGARRSEKAAVQGVLAVALVVLGYFSVGFAFHLGGAALTFDQPGLAGLDRMVGHRVQEGLFWGVLGLEGFFLDGDAVTWQMLTLFVVYLPMAATAALLPSVVLADRARGWQVALLSLVVGAVLFPLAACWTWGGGFLASLGLTVYRGHGVVDYAGSAVVYLLGGAVAVGGLAALRRAPDIDAPGGMPVAHSSLPAVLGALLLVAGWLGWVMNVPFHAGEAVVDPGHAAVNGLLSMAAATVASALYSWLAGGRENLLVIAHGAAAGLVAISAGAPFVSLWAALIIGGVAGLLLPVGLSWAARSLGLEGGRAAIGSMIANGLWGLVAVAVWADGRWGEGWNGVGVEEYRTVVGQGVTGFLAAPGFLGDGPGQLIAQLAGLGCIALLGFSGGWLVMTACNRGRRPYSARGH